MTDELSIKQRPSALPYIGIGGALGAGAGYLVNDKFITKPMSHSDIIAEVNAQDKFDARVKEGAPEASSWKDVKAKADASKAAEEELAAARKGSPVDTKLTTELEAATKAREAEYNRLLAEETRKNGGTVREVPSYKEMKAGMAANASDAKAVTRDFGRYENTLKPNYDAAVRSAKTTTEYTSVLGKRNSFASKLDAYYQEVFNAYSTKDPVAREKAIKALDRKLNFINGEFVRLTDAEILEQAYKDGQMQKITNKKWYTIADYTRTWTDKAGKRHVEHYKFNDGVKLKDLRKAEVARVQGLKDALRSEIEATHQEFVNAQQELNNFANRKEFKARSKRGGGISGNFVCNYSEITGTKLETLKAELEVVEKLKNGEKLTSKAEKTIASGLETKYGFNIREVKGLADLQATLSKRIPLAEEYAGLQEALKGAKGGAERIAAYEQELTNVLQSNKGVKSAAAKIKALAQKYGINVETVAGQDEAALKEIVEGKLKGSAVETRVAKAQAAVDEAIAKGATKVDDALVKTLEEKAATAKGELEKAAEALGKKVTKSGNKWVAMGIGAAALGLGALALRPKNN